ncbi:MAG: hypothetical protein ACLSHU_08135 [Oscillospiraceae bacterium]
MEDVHLTPRELLRAVIRRLHWVLLAAIFRAACSVFVCAGSWLLAPHHTPPQAPSMFLHPRQRVLPIPGPPPRPLTAAQKAGQAPAWFSWRATGFWIWRHSSWLRTAPQRTCGLWSPHPAWGTLEALSISVSHRDPQTATLLANAILDTAPAEILRIVHTGRIEVVDRAVLPVQPDAPTPWHAAALAACITGFSAGLAAALAGFREKRKRIARLRRRVYVDHGVTEGRAD